MAQHPVGLTQALALGDELIRRGSVELEQTEMAGDDTARLDIPGQLSRLASIKVASDSALGSVAVDGQQSDIGGKWSQCRDQTVMTEGVPAVVDELGAPAHHVSKEAAAPLFIAFHGVMG